MKLFILIDFCMYRTYVRTEKTKRNSFHVFGKQFSSFVRKNGVCLVIKRISLRRKSFLLVLVFSDLVSYRLVLKVWSGSLENVCTADIY